MSDQSNAKSGGADAVLDNVPTPIMAIDRDFTVSSMNLAGASLLGMTPEECVGKKCYDLFKTDHCRTERCACQRAMTEEKTVTAETTSRAGIEPLPIRYTGAPLRDDAGWITGAVEYVLDIRSEVAEREKVNKLVEALDGIPTPVASMDKDFNVRAINPAAAGVLGKTVEECLGQKCYDLFKTPHCRTADCACAQAMAADATVTAETVARPNGGAGLPIRYTGAPLKNEHGEVDGVVEFVLDISGEMDVRRSTKEVTDVLFKMKEGDLRGRVEEEYEGDLREVKSAMNAGLDAINELLHEVVTSSAQVAETADHSSSSSQKLAEGAQEQAAAAEEISASVAEADQQIKVNAENAAIARQLVTTTNETATAGRQEMDKMLSAMTEIAESAQSISKIMKVIDEIAFQTNILALNAAVEAARAGRYGRGFAVVAQEVRSLAGRSAKAAQETAELIDASNQKVENGVEIARNTASALEEITGNVTKVKDLVAEISTASNEQAVSISEVATGMNQIAEGVTSVTTQSEETAAAAEELSAIASGLREKVQSFALVERATFAAPNLGALPAGLTPETLTQLAALLQSQGLLPQSAPPMPALPPPQTNGGRAADPDDLEQALPLDADARGYGDF